MKEPELEEEALGGRQQGNDLIIERRTMADQAADVTVTSPSGKTAVVKLEQRLPGVFQGRLTVAEAGLHRLTDGKLSTVAAAGSADPRESGDVVATEAILRPVADATGGAIMWLDNGAGRISVPRLAMVRPGRSMAGSGWLGLKANNSYRVKEIERLPLFGSLISLALLLALVSLMWYREGR
jgi:hypothetical protein